MEVILLEKIRNLGELGERVRVRPGYARNYLLPQGKAVPATPENVAAFEARRRELEEAAARALAEAEARREALAGQVIEIAARVGGEGKLFGSVGAPDIVEAAGARGLKLERREIRLPQGPLRQVGEHEVAVQLHPDVEATIVVRIVPEE